MAEFKAVDNIQDLENLDQDDVLAGYHAGLNNEPEPGSDKSRGFHHGWKNGMTDKHRMQSTPESHRLAREIIQTGYLRKKH